jgi:hypothetical protein
VFTLRCARTLLKRMRVHPDPLPPSATTRLGDWYANLHYTRPQQLILCVSERTLLPVLVPAKGNGPVAVRLVPALGEVLRAIGVSQTDIRSELAAMADSTISTTASRSVLGSMNDFAFMLDTHLERGDTLIDAALRLADAPCSPIRMMSPREVAVEVLGGE